MNAHVITRQTSNGPPRRPASRRRAPQPAGPFAEGRPDVAMHDTARAEQLMADLLDLIDAGVVAPVHGDHEVRYVPAGPFDHAA